MGDNLNHQSDHHQSYEDWAASLADSKGNKPAEIVENKKPFFWFAQGIVGFLVFFAVVSGLLFGTLVLLSEVFGGRFIPRGLGWIVLPLAAGWLGWRLGSTLGIESAFLRARISFDDANRAARVWVASSIVWVMCCFFYLIAARPYGRYMRDDDYIHFSVIVIGPVIILAFASFLFTWALKGRA